MVILHCAVCDKSIEYRWTKESTARHICSTCRVREWRAKNPDRAKVLAEKHQTKPWQKKEWEDRERAKDLEGFKARACERSKRYYRKDPEKTMAIRRAYYDVNRDKEIQKVVAYRLRQRTPKWADKVAIAAIYGEARRLTRETGVEYHVDHIIPINGEIVSGLHVETNLQIISGFENRVKQNRYEG